MRNGGATWVVVADAETAKVFLERNWGGALVVLGSETLRRDGDEGASPGRHLATVRQSAGFGRHGAGERDPDREATQRFLRRVARHLEQRLHERAFDALAIIAPPRTLGALKTELGSKLVARLTATDDHECVGETAEQIRQRLRKARAAALSR